MNGNYIDPTTSLKVTAEGLEVAKERLKVADRRLEMADRRVKTTDRRFKATKRINICMLGLVLLVLSGCRYSFEIYDIGLEPTLCIRSFICADSTASITVHKAVPVTHAAFLDTAIVSPSLSLTCNGEAVAASVTKSGKGNRIFGSQAFKPGDTIEISMETEDVERVSAVTTVPGLFPECTTEFYTDADGEKAVRVSYKDDPETEDFYGICVMYEAEAKEDAEIISGKTHTEDAWPLGYVDHLTLDNSKKAPAVSNMMDGNYLFIWKDVDEEDNEYEVSYMDPGLSDFYRKSVYLRLFKLSEETYKTLYADYEQHYDEFAYLGFDSPSFSYTNINNGVGYFGAYSVRETEPVTIDTPNEN
ncbi:MAG: DUF4249 family protein [Bacteroidales bacterium]|nr:DUF4249 family protein [Bacteroidales bacterium]